MHPAAKTAKVAVTRSLPSPQPSQQYLWISDELVSATFARFAGSFGPTHTCRRHGSHIPGPLEARRRLERRRMNGLAIGREHAALTPPSWDWSWMKDFWRPDVEDGARYEPPTWSAAPTTAHRLAKPQSQPDTLLTETPRIPFILPFDGELASTSDAPKVGSRPQAADITHVLRVIRRMAFAPTLEELQGGHDARNQLANLLLAQSELTSKRVIVMITENLILPEHLETLGQFRQARMIDMWLTTLRENRLIDAATVEAALAVAGTEVRLRDLPEFFSTQSYDDICVSIIRHWTRDAKTDSNSLAYFDTFNGVNKYPRYQRIPLDLSIEEAFRTLRQEPAPEKSEKSRHVQPFLDLVVVLIKYKHFYREAATDVLEFLLRTDRATEWTFMYEMLHKYFDIPLPSQLRRRWILTNMIEHPLLAMRLYRLPGKHPVLFGHVPGFMQELICSPEVHPAHIHGLVQREERIISRSESSWERHSGHLFRVVNSMAMAFACCRRLETSQQRQINVVKVYDWLVAQDGELSADIAEAVILTHLLLPALEDRTPTRGECSYALTICRRVVGKDPDHELRLCSMDSSVRKIHLSRYMAERYGNRWADVINVQPPVVQLGDIPISVY